MNPLERDYLAVLLADHAPPCLSLYQPTHRRHPENQQDPIRFSNLVKALESSLQQAYQTRDIQTLLRPFHSLAEDRGFWDCALDGLAVLATREMFKLYRLQRAVPALAIVADSFHTKPLMRILQSADRYQLLALTGRTVRLFEGNRDALDEVDLASGVPRTSAEALGTKSSKAERKSRVYAGVLRDATTSHGTDVKEDKADNDMARFFRAVDSAVLQHHSQPGLPLLLATLPEHSHLFHQVSRNAMLAADAIEINPDALTIDEFRTRAWQLVLPQYLKRLGVLVDRFAEARANRAASDDLPEVVTAAVERRIGTLLIEADRIIPGGFDPMTGTIILSDLDEPNVGDLLDDLGEHVLKMGGEVLIVPAERMPSKSGVAATYRF